jgi:hypothetical protein
MLKKVTLYMLLITSALLADKVSFNKMNISLFSEAIAFPSYKLIHLPIHPGIAAGLTILEKNKKWRTHELVLEGGYFYAEFTGHSIMLFPEYNFDITLKKFEIATSIGLGYKHNIFARAVFKKVDGVYKQVTDWGTPQAMLPLGLKLGYNIPNDITLFLHYRWIAASPFNAKAGLFVMSHTTFHIGASFPVDFSKLKRGKNENL